MIWRLVDTDLCPPPFSAAADEAIALARSENVVPNTLHFYRRIAPTVSLGYFQSVEEDIDLVFCENNGIHIIRRATGGSAIYTDENHLIYGFVAREEDLPEETDDIYRKVCSAIVDGLGSLGLKAEFKPINDVLVNGKKISGSAQMRRWGIVLQHGTLILANDPDMMFGSLKTKDSPSGITSLEEELAAAHGIGRDGASPAKDRDAAGPPMNYANMPPLDEVKAALVKGFGSVFNVKFERWGLSRHEKSTIDELIHDKYGNSEWNFRK